jgi:hypothetical protein
MVQRRRLPPGRWADEADTRFGSGLRGRHYILRKKKWTNILAHTSVKNENRQPLQRNPVLPLIAFGTL